MRVTVRVPATSANLGAGFDCFGLALDLCNEVTIDTDGPERISWDGEGAAELPTDGSDLIGTTMRCVAGDRPLPSFAMHATNRIPLARGLGSSSAAVVAGVAAALVLLGESPAPHDVFAPAAEVEGHPDNVAAACYGGFTIATPDGFVRRIDADERVRPTVFVPSGARLSTDRARAALPPTVPLADAVFNIAHAALALEAFTRDPTLLARALRDRLHQDVRLDLEPSVRETYDRLRDAGLAVCVSGSGPALLVVDDGRAELPDPGAGWEVRRLAVRATGFEVARA